MVARDQEVRNQLMVQGKLNEGYQSEMEKVHKENAQQLERIIHGFGWPGVEKVGKEGNEAAWTIVQHAIGEPDFMYKCRAALREALKTGDSTPQQLAYLEDRIHFFERRPQKYGTQFDWDSEGNLSPWTLSAPEEVNAFRKSLGWETLEEKTAEMRRLAQERNEKPPDFHQRQTEMEAWRKAAGWVIPFDFLETERLLLREFNPKIMDLVHLRYDDEQLRLFFGTNQAEDIALQREKAKERLTAYKQTFKYWHLIPKGREEVIGWCGFHTWKLRHDKAEVGYVMTNHSYRQKGLMKEALEKVIDFGFTEMNLHRISALVGPHNEPSLNLIRGNGL